MLQIVADLFLLTRLNRQLRGNIPEGLRLGVSDGVRSVLRTTDAGVYAQERSWKMSRVVVEATLLLVNFWRQQGDSIRIFCQNRAAY